MGRFKKGSKEAKDFMAKIRKLRGKPMKTSVKLKTVKYIKRSMARRKSKSHSKPSFTLPIAPVIGIVAMPDIQEAARYAMLGDFPAVFRSAQQIIGIDASTKRFNSNLLVNNMLPLGIGLTIHWFASKFGINRMLGRMKIPIFRI